MGTEGKQMRGVLVGSSSTTHRLAIQCKRIIWRCLQGRSYPVGKRPFDLLCIQARKQFAVQRITGTGKTTDSEQVRQQTVLLTTPLPNSQGGITVTQQRRNQTRQQKGQFIAQSVFGARIRDGCKEFIQAEEWVLLE
jgi:hypothetical protein